MSAGTNSPAAERRVPAWAVFALVALAFTCAIYANLSFAVKNGADYKYFPPFKPYANANANSHLGAEYLCIAQALVAGRGFADPFREQTGPTAWMPPILPAFTAVLLWAFGGNRDAVMAAVVFAQVYTLILTGLLVVAVAVKTGSRGGALLAAAAFAAALVYDFNAHFQFTHDGWLVMLALDLLVAGLVWGAPLASPWRAAAWGLYGGFCALVNPIAGFAWGALTLAAGVRRPHRPALAAAVVAAALAVAPWTARNYLVFGRLIPVKSNAAYELYQSQCLQPDGMLQLSTFSTHPYASSGRERQEYKALGEIAFLDHKREQFRTALADDPVNFLFRVGDRLLGTTVWYTPFEREAARERPLALLLARVVYPLPFLAAVLLLATAFWRPLDPAQWAVLGVYGFYLLPYALVSYYARYSMPLLGVKVLLVVWGVDRLVSLASGRRAEAVAEAARPKVAGHVQPTTVAQPAGARGRKRWLVALGSSLALAAVALWVSAGGAGQKPETTGDTPEAADPFDVFSVAASADGRFLVAGGGMWDRPGEVGVWNLATRSPIRRQVHGNGVASVALSPDGTRMAFGSWDGRARVCDFATGSELAECEVGRVARVAFSPDGRLLATAAEGGPVQLWDAANGTLLTDLAGDTFRFHCVAFSPDGARLFAGGGTWQKGGPANVHVWNVATRMLLFKLTGHENTVLSVAVSRDGKFVATGSVDSTVRLWDAANGQMVKTLAGHRSGVECVAFAPDGRTLVSGGHDRTVRVWDVAGGKESARIDLPTEARAVGLTADGATLIVGGGRKTLRLYDAASRAPAGVLWDGAAAARPVTGGRESDATLFRRAVEAVRALEADSIDARQFPDVGDADLAALRGLPNLKNLNLDGTRVTDAGLASLAGVPSVTQLSLSKTAVGDAGLARLAPLAGLDDLRLDETAVTDAGMAHLAAFRQLRRLSLYRTRVTDAGLARLGDAFFLERLSLDETAVSDAGLRPLHALRHLRDLRLWNTKVTAAGVGELRAALPKLEVKQ